MDNKNKLLFKGLAYDALGMVTLGIPVVGPLLDLAWAPFAAKKMGQMYPGKKGRLASILVFIEEVLPFTDIIPSFTLMWLYTYKFSERKASTKEVLQAEVIKG